MSDPIIYSPAESRANFKAIGEKLNALGLVVLGLDGTTKVPWLQWAHFGQDPKVAFPTRSSFLGHTLQSAVSSNRSVNPAIHLGGNPDRRLVVIDVDGDVEKNKAWAIQTFGATPLMVSSGRVGGGVHLYYRVSGPGFNSAHGMIGPVAGYEQKPEKSGAIKSLIDVKAGNGYVVAPGAQHKTGLIYKVLNGVKVTPELLDSLPVITLAHLQSLKAERQAELAALKPAPVDTDENHAAPIAQHQAQAVEGDLLLKIKPWSHLFGGQTQDGQHYPLSAFDGIEKSGAIAKCKCPAGCPGNSEYTANILVHENGEAWVYCHRCETGFHRHHAPVASPVALETNDSHKVVGGVFFGRAVEALEFRKERYLTSFALSQAWDRARDTGITQVVMVRSPRETGKSTVTAKELNGLRKHVLAVTGTAADCIDVGPRTILSRVHAAQFGMLDYAQANEGDLHNFHSVSVCLPSIHKVLRDNLDVLILDEAQQTLGLFAGSGSILKSFEDTFASLSFLATKAKVILAMDADLDDRTVEALRVLRGVGLEHSGEGETVIVNDEASALIPRAAYVETGDKAGKNRQRAALIKDITLGRRASVFTSSRRDSDVTGNILAGNLSSEDADCDELEALILSSCPGKKVLKINSQTSASLPEFFNNPVAYIKEHKPDALVYTSSMGTGLDLAGEGLFDVVYAFISAGVHTQAYSAMQALERVRNPTDLVRKVWIDSRAMSLCTIPAKLAGERISVAITAKTVAAAIRPINKDIAVPRDQEALEFSCRIEASVNREINRPRETMLSEFKRLNWSVSFANDGDKGVLDMEQVADLWKSEALSARAVEISAIINAPEIDLTVANNILQRVKGSDQSKLASAHKAKIVELVGAANVDERSVELYLSKKLHRIVSHYAVFQASALHDTVVLEGFASTTKRRLRSTTTTRDRLVGGRLAYLFLTSAFEITGKLGFDSEIKLTAKEQTHWTAAEWAKQLKKHGLIATTKGATLPRMAQEVCAALGLTSKSQRGKVNGEKVWVSTSITGFETLAAWAKKLTKEIPGEIFMDVIHEGDGFFTLGG